MAIASTVDLLTTQLWPQGDIRDPLGIWGARLGITGDASGDGIKVGIQAAQPERAAFIYTIYSLNISQLTGGVLVVAMQSRILTNWPNIDPIAGVQAYSTNLLRSEDGSGNLTPPVGGPDDGLVLPNDRFLLCFDPRPQPTTPLVIAELRVNSNVLNNTWSFEGYGYFWDRSVLNAPGGPRHPGSS